MAVIDIRFDAMLVFQDGDPDPLPLSEATDQDIRDGVLRTGWYARWRVGDEQGSWQGPFAGAAEADLMESV